MPVAKLLGANTPDAMKSEEGNDSLDTFMRQTSGKEPVFSFSRTGDSPVQWIQLLHALDQQELPGWPLLAPVKVQMQKCEKCAREFCSPINYRRHIRVHRRSMNFHKEPQKYRDLLGAFWDKLSYDEAKEIMSFKDVNLQEVPGCSIVRNIAANLRKPMFLSLPQVYVKAGSALVDIVQGRTSRLPISSQELFSILDDASEKTFLCAGTAESLQKYVFDGEAGKIGLEMKNLIACTSFLIEQKLVTAWLADKDAEALRCQKLLVEEEEAAQRRQAQVLERKRQRKIRQKEQKANTVKVDDLDTTSDIIFESIPLAETSAPQISSEEHVIAPLDPIHLSNNEEAIDIEAQGGCSSDHSDSTTTQHQKSQGNHFVTRWQVQKSQRGGRNSHQNSNHIKWEHQHKLREQRVNNNNINNSNKVWTRKPKSENNKVELVKSGVVNNDEINTNCQLMIGSISVTVRKTASQQQVNSQENGNTEVKTTGVVQNGSNRCTVKFWKARLDTRGEVADRSDNSQNQMSEKGTEQTLSSGSCNQPCDLNGNDKEGSNDSNVQVEDGAKVERIPFSVDAAKAFLAQRWKDATSGEHVELVVASAPEPPGQLDHEPPGQIRSPKGKLGKVAKIDQGNGKGKFRTKGEKSVKTKYIPKQTAV